MGQEFKYFPVYEKQKDKTQYRKLSGDNVRVEQWGNKEVGEKNQFNEHWINSTGKAFVKELPKGWQNRTFEIYKGSNLTVLSLGRIDLIFSKLLAELDRAEDLEDVKGLKPSISELDIVAEPLMALENNQAWKKKVSELISILKRIKSNG